MCEPQSYTVASGKPLWSCPRSCEWSCPQASRPGARSLTAVGPDQSLLPSQLCRIVFFLAPLTQALFVVTSDVRSPRLFSSAFRGQSVLSVTINFVMCCRADFVADVDVKSSKTSCSSLLVYWLQIHYKYSAGNWNPPMGGFQFQGRISVASTVLARLAAQPLVLAREFIMCALPGGRISVASTVVARRAAQPLVLARGFITCARRGGRISVTRTVLDYNTSFYFD